MEGHGDDQLFLVKVNTTELQGPSKALTFSCATGDSFGALRQQIATKIGRPQDAAFIAAAISVQGYHTSNLNVNTYSHRHANLTASSGLFNSPLSYIPLDTENVFETLQIWHLQHNGREITVNARDRRLHAQVIGRGEESVIQSESSQLARTGLTSPQKRQHTLSATSEDMLEIFDDGSLGPTDTRTSHSHDSKHFSERHGALEVLVADAGGELVEGEAGSGEATPLADGDGTNTGKGAHNPNSYLSDIGEKSGWASCSRALFAEVEGRCLVHSSVLLSAATGPKEDIGNGESSSSWGLFRSSGKKSDTGSGKDEPRAVWAMTDGDHLYFCNNPTGLAVPGGHGGGYATNTTIGTAGTSSNNASSSNVGGGPAGSSWLPYLEPLMSIELDKHTEIRVVHSGDVLVEAVASPVRGANSLKETKEVAPPIIPGGFPPPPKSQNYRFQIVSHSGPRGGVEPKAVSYRRASTLVRAAAVANGGVLLQSDAPAKKSSFLRTSFASGRESSSSNPTPMSGVSSANVQNPKPEGGVVLCTIELGPEATTFDLGEWVKALTSRKCFSKFSCDSSEFELEPVTAPPSIDKLALNDRTDGKVSMSPMTDLMEMADAAIGSSEKHVAAADICALREASLGLAGTMAYQPLRSAFKRKVGERLADENLLFWCHAKDFELTMKRRNNSELDEKGGMDLDALIDTPVSALGLSVGDQMFEAALCNMAQETVTKYLSKKASRRIAVGSGAATETEVKRVTQEVEDAVSATREARSNKSFTARGGQSVRAKPPPPPGTPKAKQKPRACPTCTFMNEKPEAIVCELCTSKLPEHESLAPPPPQAVVSMDAIMSKSDASSGLGRSNPGAIEMFTSLTESVFRYMESSDDFLEFSSAKSDSYRNLLLAVPAFLRANRRGQSNPLSLRLQTSREFKSNPKFSQLASLSEDSPPPPPPEPPARQTPRGSFFSSSSMTMNSNTMQSPGMRDRAGSSNEIGKSIGSRTMSSRLLGLGRKKNVMGQESRSASDESKSWRSNGLNLPQQEAAYLDMSEEALINTVSTELVRESEADSSLRGRCFSDMDLMSSYELRKQVGALPDGHSWPDLCWSGFQGKAMLKGSIFEVREASKMEPTSTAGQVMAHRWWKSACASSLQSAHTRVRQRSKTHQASIPKWSPCLLEGPQPGAGRSERRTIHSAMLSYERKRKDDCLNQWVAGVSSHGPASHVVWRQGFGGVGTAISNSALRFAHSPEPRTLTGVSAIPGRIIMSGPVRCVWRKGAGDKTSTSTGGLGVGAALESGEVVEGWPSSDRLNTFTTFSANAAKYICVLSEVYDNVPISTAASESGFSEIVPRDGRRESIVGAHHVTSRVSVLCFLRAKSGRLERIVHLRDLAWVGAALKPLHAISFADNQGECGVMLPGFSGPDAASADHAAATRDVWFNAMGRAGGQRAGNQNLVKVPFTEGVIRKKGGGAIQRWQPRRFVLDYSAQTMRYYDETTGEMKGSIPLSTIEHVTPGNDAYFTLVSKPTDLTKGSSKKTKDTRLWDLQAVNREEMLDWVAAIEQCISMRRQHIRTQQAIQTQTNNPNVLAGRPASSRNLRPVRGNQIKT